MKPKSYRLDRFISQHSSFTLSEVRLLIAQKRIKLDGRFAISVQEKVSEFTEVQLDEHYLRNNLPHYLMLHKPQGVVSATKDDKHKTVLDLIDHPAKSQLHLAGRLDLNSTGMVLLTNDGAWSRALSLPDTKVKKVYEVVLSNPIEPSYVAVFERGIYFSFEDITTKPAKLEVISSKKARLTLTEGKYHQVKRMFGYFQNEVLALHRIAIGNLSLGDLEPGSYRPLTSAELQFLRE
ncbi:MAG: pseudouridine synthase [Pseudohongiellaceae bacterium]